MIFKSQFPFAAAMVLIAAGCGTDNQTAPPPPPDKKAFLGPNPDPIIAETWVAKPVSEWPQIVLTNYAEFDGHTSLEGASGFLIRTDRDQVFAATAAHLIGAAGGVEPTIPIDQLTDKIKSWVMFPRTDHSSSVAIVSVGVDGLDRGSRDWLILAIADSDSLPAYPLKVRKTPVQVGESVFLIGCPYSEEDCRQNVYQGTVKQREFGTNFRFDLDPPVELPGFSGAPIVDANGHLVGVTTVWFERDIVDGKDRICGGEDFSSIHHLFGSPQ